MSNRTDSGGYSEALVCSLSTSNPPVLKADHSAESAVREGECAWASGPGVHDLHAGRCCYPLLPPVNVSWHFDVSGWTGEGAGTAAQTTETVAVATSGCGVYNGTAALVPGHTGGAGPDPENGQQASPTCTSASCGYQLLCDLDASKGLHAATTGSCIVPNLGARVTAGCSEAQSGKPGDSAKCCFPGSEYVIRRV